MAIPFSACLFSIVVLRPLAVHWGLVDTPDNRKQHRGNIPLIGGLAIYIAVMTSISLLISQHNQINLLLISVSLMVLIGALDDRYDLNAKLRLVAQVLISAVLVFGADVRIEQLGNVFGFGEVALGNWSSPVTILAFVAGINAFNMTDGIDGLAGALSLISLAAVGLVLGDAELIKLVVIISISIIVFLLFNLGFFTKNNKVFMGDAGSMMLGLVVVWFLIKGSQGESASFKPAIALWFIAVPLLDMVAVMYRRMKRGKSPLKADREHLHHVFMELGLSSKQALIFISLMAVFFAAFGLIINKSMVSESVSLFLFVASFVLYNILLTNRAKLKMKKNKVFNRRD